MKSSFKNIRISHIATSVPKEVLEIRSLNNFFNQDLEQITMHTGIESVHVAPSHLCTSDLSEAAAKYIFEKFKVDPQSIDALLFVSQTPDYIFPATSVILQSKLGLSKNVVSFDINYGCSGYIYGLFQAALLLNTNSCHRVLLLAGDTLTKYIHTKDRSLRLIIGDGSSATIIEKGEGTMHFNIKTDGTNYQNVIVPAGGCRLPKSETTSIVSEREFNNFRCDENFYMNGMEVMNFSLKEVPLILNETLEYTGWSKEEVGFYGLHQANKFLIEYVCKKAKLDVTKVPISLKNFGNTSVASIPIMLTNQYEKLRFDKRLNKAILCGFGVGFSWGAVTLNLSETNFCGPIEI